MKAVLLRAQSDSKRFPARLGRVSNPFHPPRIASAGIDEHNLAAVVDPIAGSLQQRAVGLLSKPSQMMIVVNIINILLSAFGSSKLALGALLQCLAKLASSLGGRKNSRGDRRKR